MFRINGDKVNVERFPDGTLRLNIEVQSKDVLIEWLFEKDEEMTIFFIVRHLREQCSAENIELYMPYIPHARMDRVKNPGEVFTLRYFCEFINALGFDRVIVRDAHSDVSLALLENVVSESVEGNIRRLADELLDVDDMIFYPDEGSYKRYMKQSNRRYAFGVKKRDWNTGKIEGLDIQGDVPNGSFDVLIVDDISSYGGTFFYSAKKLKELGADKIYLYITHCENSILEGDLIKSGLITKIYTTKSIFTGKDPLIEVLEGNRYE